MRDLQKEITDRMIILTDGRLLQIIHEEPENYEKAAINIAKEILRQRGIDIDSSVKAHENTKIDTDSNENKEESIPIIYELVESSGGYESLFDTKDEIIEKSKSRMERVRPWTRFWARTIDLSIWSFLIGRLLENISGQTYKFTSSFAYGIALNIIVFVTWILVEGILILKFGFTFGKWLLKISITEADGQRISLGKSFKRVFFVWVYGEGLYIPFVNIVANIIAYSTLNKQEITVWDRKLKLSVTHGKIGLLRSALAVIVIVLPIIISFIQAYENMV